MRTPLRTLAAVGAATLLGTACGSSTDPRRVDPEVPEAVLTLDRIADSLQALGVDEAVSSAYHAFANVIRGDPGVSSVVITVDGTPAEYFATAQRFDRNYCSPGAICPSIYQSPFTTMLAWQRNNPRRLVQLTTDGDLFRIGALPDGDAPYASRATLTFLDGAGGIFTGGSGTQAITMAPPTDAFCAGPHAAIEALDGLATSWAQVCKRAEFTAAFDGTVQPPAFPLRGNTASGSHTVAMAAQAMSGTYLLGPYCSITCAFAFPPYRPPIGILGNSNVLRPTLKATVAGRDVTLELTVRNISSAPAQLDFSSAQQYDFIVRSATSGTVAWQWSRGMGFATVLTSRTLAAGEAAVYSEHWNAAAGGAYSAEGMLTSTSHRAAASTSVVLP